MSARSGEEIWLRSSWGPLRIFLGEPPRGTKGKRFDPMHFTDELRSWVINGTGAYHLVWYEIYEWLGAPFPRPPTRRDIVRVADRLVKAFEEGQLVAMQRVPPLAGMRGAPPPAVPREAAASTRREPPRERPVETEPGTTWFLLRVVDEVGIGIDGLDVTYDVLGEQRVAKTNAAGEARIDTLSTGFASVAVRDLRAVRTKLRERWKEAREERIPEGAKIVVREIGEEVLEPIGLECEVPATLVIRPYSRCHPVPGVHFAFGRSFPLATALDPLAAIAEELFNNEHRKAMVFGHTDLAGPEALNKELSERRAKAILAMLTHDAHAWEELFSGTADGPNWKEKWGVLEAQHMLNALGVTDDDGRPLKENGIRDKSTKEAIHRFQAGDYPDRPGEQKPLAKSDLLGEAGRRELFLAYAKRVTRNPVENGRFTPVDGLGYMGCGEYNPLSLEAKDAESRRVAVLVFDPAAEPQRLPCRHRSVGACKGNLRGGDEPPKDEGRPYRCRVYERISRNCSCGGGEDASHDLVLVFPITLRQADELAHSFVLESEDATISRKQVLMHDARANDEQRAELYFNHLPETHSYCLRCDEGDGLMTLLDYDKLPVLQAKARAAAASVVVDPSTAALHDAWLLAPVADTAEAEEEAAP